MSFVHTSTFFFTFIQHCLWLWLGVAQSASNITIAKFRGRQSQPGTPISAGPGQGRGVSLPLPNCERCPHLIKWQPHTTELQTTTAQHRRCQMTSFRLRHNGSHRMLGAAVKARVLLFVAFGTGLLAPSATIFSAMKCKMCTLP